MHSQIPSREPGTAANEWECVFVSPPKLPHNSSFLCYFIPESYFSIKARKQGNNKEIIIGRQNSCILKFHQESLGQRLMNGYVSLSAHPSYPITLLFFVISFLSLISRSKQENKEIRNNMGDQTHSL